MTEGNDGLPAYPVDPVAERLCPDGLLELRAGRFVLSASGPPLGDWVARTFLDA